VNRLSTSSVPIVAGGLTLMPLALLAGLLTGLLGCGSNTAETLPPSAAATSPAPAPSDREFWEVHQIGGVRVGYAHTAVKHQVDPGSPGKPPVAHLEGLSQMSFQRAGQSVAMGVQFDSHETAEGQLLDFTCAILQGSTLIQKTQGKVVGDVLQLETTTQGKSQPGSLPWSAAYGGLMAAEQSLWRKPMQPQEQRTIEALVPGFNQVGKNELAAGQYESVDILGQKYDLLRIETTTTFAGGQCQRGTVWMDRHGDLLKKSEEALNLESYRVPKAVALAESSEAPFDLVLGLSVNVDRRLPQPHDTRQIRYLLELQGSDPTAVFPPGSSQAVQRLDAHRAEVTVYAVRPDRPGYAQAPADPASDDDRQPNNLIQSDDPKIVAMARRVAPEENDPWQVAVALEKFVRDFITRSDYSQAFSTAAQVASSGAGDCTEHAVLLAALCRARGIPARVAVGLVYTEQTGHSAFGYHMWNEACISDRWIPLDSTLGRGGIGAAHLKLAHSSLASASAFSGLLPVAKVAGRLSIKIEDVQ
jgi:hypothetical protein